MASTHKHIRSGTANKRPTTAIADGQIALNTNATSPGLFFKDSTGATLIKVGPVHIGATAPNASPATGGSAGNSTGEIWLDTSLTPNGVKIWDGSAWVNATPIGSTTVQGLLELATNAETQTGSDTARAVTPAGLQSKLSDSTSTTSSTTIASSTAVKAAYDLANAALPKSGGTVTGNLEIGTSGSLSFEGATADAFETTIAITDPTADRTITLPDTTGTIITTGDTGTVTSTMIANGTIVNGDINASAAIAGTKISPDFGSQTVQTTGIFSAALGAQGTPSLTFTGDTNTGIYSPGADQVAISTNGSGRLFVASTGSVGVGVSNPGYRLDIQDSMNIKIDGSNLARVFFNGTGTRISYADATGHLSLFTNSTERCYVGYGGGFSIISGGLNVSGGNIALSGGDRSIINNDANALILGTNGTERMRLDSSGRLGLGTSSPSTLIHAVGTSANLILDRTGDNPAIIFRANGTNSAGVSTELNTLRFETGSGLTERMRIDSSGRVGIGSTSVQSLGANYTTLEIKGKSGGYGGGIILSPSDAATSPAVWYYDGNCNFGSNTSTPVSFLVNGSERGRWDTSGRFLVGTSTARGNFFNASFTPTAQIEGASGNATYLSIVSNANSTTGEAGIILGKTRGTAVGQNTAVQSQDLIGYVSFQGSDGSELVSAAVIYAEVDGTPGANDMPGRLVFSTTADGASSPSERMRITSAGELLVGATATVGANRVFIAVGDQNALGIKTGQGAGNQNLVRFYDSTDTVCGVISIDSGANTTTYGTSSDYRLKQNIIKLANATTRLLALKPVNFNFIADDLNRVFDGFIAHEVETVVPEAVVGEKDGVDDQGSPVFQVIDQSKLVPLLTAALQETLAEIATLKDRVAALEAR